ncbi:GrpB family protein [Hymenobacter wooponensis]|uniref:GrpB family protein n=1 Tax=Hymenobacter wooponensis TaxID=1525360 RepID=A0A4Z0ME58_9BACT|nr:GrpB family protein [Hymenobacter wooponensis]TGD77578.1 GrpB family protein [Hymenobacter wooponensis]
MSTAPPFASSRPVLLPYQPRWAREFAALAQRLAPLVGSSLLRIDHIGSTAVPGLQAKDVLDVQLTVADLTQTAELTRGLTQAGFQLRAGFRYDEFGQLPAHCPDLRKLYWREPAGERRLHLHVREAGRFNTRFALLMRDYLRAQPAASQAYGRLKQRAATLFPSSIEGYLYIKAPVFELLYHAAAGWAAQTGWEPPAGAA